MTSAFSRILQALALLVLFGAAHPASAQRVEFDIFEQSDFDKLIASGKPVIVHLNTTWWPVCKRQVLALDEIRQKPAYKNYAFLRLNFDTEAAFKAKYQTPVRSVIMLFKNGKEVERLTAEADPAKIEALLKKAI